MFDNLAAIAEAAGSTLANTLKLNVFLTDLSHFGRVNEIMAAADDLISHYGFVLPPFANWSPDQFKANAPAAARVISGRCGWDITDYGQGRFDDLGLFLFTLRNGELADLQRGGGMCFAQKA